METYVRPIATTLCLVNTQALGAQAIPPTAPRTHYLRKLERWDELERAIKDGEDPSRPDTVETVARCKADFAA